MKAKRFKAIILHRVDYGEADRILQIATPSGQVSAIAKGVRREGSRLAGGIELLAVCDLVVNQGKSDLGIITSAKIDKFYGKIMSDFKRLQFAYQVIDLIRKDSQSTDDSEWFDLLNQTLIGLDQVSFNLNMVKIWFYLRYANLMGYELSLYYDVDGNKLSADSRYSYNEIEKGLKTDVSGNLNSDHIKLLRLFATKSLDKLNQISGIKPLLAECLDVTLRHAAI